MVVGSNGATINVIRLDAAGAVDTAFGIGGLTAISTISGSTQFNAPRMHMLPTGEMLLVTFSRDFEGLWSLSVIKLDANGGLEQGFGVGGMATTLLSNQPLNTVGRLGAVAVDSLGRIVATGTSPSNQSMVARWTASGVSDETFAAHGVALDPPFVSTCGDDATIDAHDRIVVVCPYSDRPFGVNPIARIRRYLPDGSLDVHLVSMASLRCRQRACTPSQWPSMSQCKATRSWSVDRSPTPTSTSGSGTLPFGASPMTAN